MHSKFKLVRVGRHYSVHFSEYGETSHPVVGPLAEGEALYVGQLRVRERIAAETGEFVVWDVGLGAAANALTVLRSTRNLSGRLHLVSFDNSLGALAFAVTHSEELGFVSGYEDVLLRLGRGEERIEFKNGTLSVIWETRVADFPSLLKHGKVDVPAPHAILFDPFSPKTNPAMWTQSVFTNLFQQLDPKRACALATYSRSSIIRVSLLNAGFFVGAGRATGEKEETTIAANRLELIAAPLGLEWLKRVRSSGSAEPLHDPVYRQAMLSAKTWEKLKRHPQFLA